MYCPKCSQQQVSDEMRFCSRCGFPLSAVRKLVAGEGAFIEHRAEAQAGQLSRSQKGVRKGAWMMLASLALTLGVGLITAVDDEFAILLFLPVLCFIIGFARVLYGVFLAEKMASLVKRDAPQPQVASIMPGQLGTNVRSLELPPLGGKPAEGFNQQRMKTAEMVQPPSVTENTTRLLDEEADPHRG
jgi:hypothetical protein